MDNNQSLKTAFTPLRLGRLELKNRFIKVATYEGMTADGNPTRQLADFHSRIADGGVGLTTVAYGAVCEDGRTHAEQLLIQKGSVPALRHLADGVHLTGGRISMQLTHCGFFTRNKRILPQKPVSPSRTFNAYGVMSGLPFSRAMKITDLNRIANAFSGAAEKCNEAGFDAVEIHMGHGYLLSQFLSPGINKRKDKYGGSLANRMRFPLEVLSSVRNALPDDFPVLVKLNLNDGFAGGLQIDESIEVARALDEHGAKAIILSGSYTSRTPFYLMRGKVPLKGMVEVEKNRLQKLAIALFGPFIMRRHEFEENYFLALAMKMRQSVSVPLVYQGGVVSSRGIAAIMRNGFDAVGVGRALIHDPEFAAKVRHNENHVSPCNHCNLCMVEMDRGGVRCVI